MTRGPRDTRSSAKSTLGKVALQRRFVPAEGMRSGPRRREKRATLLPFEEQLGAMTIAAPSRERAEAAGLPAVDLKQLTVGTGVARMVPIELARDYGILVLDVGTQTLPAAVAEPPEQAHLDEFEFLLGRPLTCYLADAADLVVAIEGVYAAKNRGEAVYFMASEGADDDPITGEVPAPPTETHERAPERGAASVGGGEGDAKSEAAPVAVPMVKLDPAFSEPPPALEPPPKADFAGKELLLGGIGAETHEALRSVLAEQGLALRVAADGQELIAAVEASLPSALLLETELAGVHGLEVMRRLRGAHPPEELPMLVVSRVHHGWRFGADLSLNFGIDHFFELPLDVSRVVRALRCVLLGEPACEDSEVLEPEAETALREGMAAFERGDLDAAIAGLEAGVFAAPGTFQLEYHLGLLFGRRGDFFSAMAALEHAAQRRPRHFSALKNLAVVYQRAGFRHKATETWERAMWNAPDEETRATIKEHMLRLL